MANGKKTRLEQIKDMKKKNPNMKPKSMANVLKMNVSYCYRLFNKA